MAETRNYPRQLVVRVSEDTYQRLKAAADADRRPPTQLARKILEDWLTRPPISRQPWGVGRVDSTADTGADERLACPPKSGGAGAP